MNKKNQNGVIIIIVPIAIVAILVGIILYSQVSSKNTAIVSSPTNPASSTSQSSNLKTYKSSDLMNFEIQIPNHYVTDEKFGIVTITSPEGKIQVSQNGSEYENLDAHISALVKLNRVSFAKEANLTIDNLPAQVGKLNNEKSYFIYSGNRVYTFSTDSEALYGALDQIAKSFRYTPNQN